VIGIFAMFMRPALTQSVVIHAVRQGLCIAILRGHIKLQKIAAQSPPMAFGSGAKRSFMLSA
jgi:hypothetical protein